MALLSLVQAPASRVEQSDIETLISMENGIRAMQIEYDNFAGELLRKMRAGAEVEPGPYHLRLEETSGHGERVVRLRVA